MTTTVTTKEAALYAVGIALVVATSLYALLIAGLNAADMNDVCKNEKPTFTMCQQR